MGYFVSAFGGVAQEVWYLLVPDRAEARERWIHAGTVELCCFS